MSTDLAPAPAVLGDDWELRAIVSSTWRDLAKYRNAVKDACLAAKVIPIMMEHLLPQDIDIVKKSTEMVDRAHIYVGLFGRRYGTVPSGEERSVTEIEYDRALALGLERLIFTKSDEQPSEVDPLEMTPEVQEGLRRFRARLGSLLTAEFTGVENLKRLVQGALHESRLRRLLRELQRVPQVLDAERRQRSDREAEMLAPAHRLEPTASPNA